MNCIKKINLLTTGILLILSGILISILLTIDIIPFKYLIPLLIGYGICLTIIFILTIKKKNSNKLRILIIILSIIWMIVLGFIFYYLNSTITFMKHIQTKEYQIEEYYIIVLKKSNYQTLSDLENQTLGTYQNKLKNYSNTLNKTIKEISIREEKYLNHIEACNALLNNKISSLLISSSDKLLAEEEINNFKDNVRILNKNHEKIEVEKNNYQEKNITNTPINIYISGIDIAGNISLVSRSDVNMIVTINPNTHQILLTSIPRDYYVQLHGTTGLKDKLTHSGIYGINMTTSTVEDLLGINIDYYVRVNFTTLINLVDTIGGIDIYSDKTFRAYTNPICTYPEGNIHVDGKCALAFARERYAYESGDRHRIQNQQDVVKAILNKTLTSKTLITKYTTILETLRYSFQTNIPTNTIYQFVNMQLDSMPSWNIEQIRLDGYDSSNYTYSYYGQVLYVMEPDQFTIDIAKQKINSIMNNSV